MNTKINELMNQPMSRKDFLLRLAGIALLITGIAGMAQRFRGFEAQTRGYGSSPYGGQK